MAASSEKGDGKQDSQPTHDYIEFTGVVAEFQNPTNISVIPALEGQNALSPTLDQRHAIGRKNEEADPKSE
jgi:hypothetical protein